MSSLTPAELLSIGIAPRFSYDSTVAQIVAANGVWVPIPVTEISGRHVTAKQNSITQSARVRGWLISTTTRCPGFVYARLVGPR